MTNLTPKQQRIYDFIRTFTRQMGYPPTVREIGQHVGVRSPSTVKYHLDHLRQAGLEGDVLLNALLRPDGGPGGHMAHQGDLIGAREGRIW